jgi:hypothetical protein
MNRILSENCIAGKYTKLLEMSRDDILKGSEPDPFKKSIRERSQGYRYRLERVVVSPDTREVVVKFVCSTAGHEMHSVYVALDSFWDLFDENESSEKKVNMAYLINMAIMQGDIRCSCTCPSWIYSGAKYIGTQLGYAYGGKETRFPRVKNPQLKGSICKHLFVVLKALPFQKFGIASQVSAELRRLHLLDAKPEPEPHEETGEEADNQSA